MGEPEEEKNASVFDFIYVDKRRIDLFLSQFSEYGNLTRLVRSSSVGDSSSLKGGIPKIVEGGTESSHRTGVEKHYDTQWLAALNFLKEVQDRRMLKRELAAANIGDLIILRGALNLVNMRAFERTWSAISDLPGQGAATGNRQQRRATQSQQRTPAIQDSSGLKILASLEQPIFMLFQHENARLWSTVEQDSVIGSATDLHLKHGIAIAGNWHLIGVLDCLPGPANVTAAQIGRFCGDGGNEFSDAIVSILRELRLVMGRPSDCYGITPLIIMREIGETEDG